MRFRPPPPCYHEVRDAIKRHGIGAVRRAAQVIGRTLGVKASPPGDVKLVLMETPLRVEGVLARGGYDPYRRIIVLAGDLWCWKTLIHETLHSMSAFFRDEELIPYSLEEWRLVVEGLTEFLTGCVLYRQRRERECYEYWVRRRYAPCRISYERYVRTFAALTQTLGITRCTLNKIFFHGAVRDWRSEYWSFLQSYGLPDLFRAWRGPQELEGAILKALMDGGRKRAAEEFGVLTDEELVDLKALLDSTYSSL